MIFKLMWWNFVYILLSTNFSHATVLIKYKNKNALKLYADDTIGECTSAVFRWHKISR